MEAYQSKKRVLNTSKQDSTRRIRAHIASVHACVCHALKGRRVLLIKYFEATIPRKDATKRLRTYFVALDIIRHSKQMCVRIRNGLREYELVGFDVCNIEVRVHIREERVQNDRRLFLISSFSVE